MPVNMLRALRDAALPVRAAFSQGSPYAPTAFSLGTYDLSFLLAREPKR